MPTDAKCGLLAGVGVVLAVAVLCFPKDPPAAPPPAASPAPAVQNKQPTRPAAVEPPTTAVSRIEP